MIIIRAIWNTFISVNTTIPISIFTVLPVNNEISDTCPCYQYPEARIKNSKSFCPIPVFWVKFFPSRSINYKNVNIYFCSEPYRIKKSNNIMNPNLTNSYYMWISIAERVHYTRGLPVIFHKNIYILLEFNEKLHCKCNWKQIKETI